MQSEKALPRLRPGDLLDKRYRVKQRLGGGGVGDVYLALDEQENKEVAIKFLRAELLHDERHLHRFLREFRAVSRLDHPNCLRVFAEGSDLGLRYFVMEYIEGGDLHDLGVDAPLPKKLAVLHQICIALHYIHSQDIIHRDLKPHNIMLVPGEPPLPKLADFGLAKLSDSNPNSKSAVTQVGEMVGTMAYMSPEQIRGEKVDPRTDLYALGCLFFFLWTGDAPFCNMSFYEVLCAHLDRSPPSLQSINPDTPDLIEELALALLAKNAADRPQTAQEVIERLHPLLEQELPPEYFGQQKPTPIQETSIPLFHPPPIGRERELNRLQRISERIFHEQNTRAPLIVLCGEVGVGKSHLLDALRANFTENGVHVINVEVTEDNGTSYYPFSELETTVATLQQEFRQHPPFKPDSIRLVKHNFSSVQKQLQPTPKAHFIQPLSNVPTLIDSGTPPVPEDLAKTDFSLQGIDPSLLAQVDPALLQGIEFSAKIQEEHQSSEAYDLNTTTEDLSELLHKKTTPLSSIDSMDQMLSQLEAENQTAIPFPEDPNLSQPTGYLNATPFIEDPFDEGETTLINMPPQPNPLNASQISVEPQQSALAYMATGTMTAFSEQDWETPTGTMDSELLKKLTGAIDLDLSQLERNEFLPSSPAPASHWDDHNEPTTVTPEEQPPDRSAQVYNSTLDVDLGAQRKQRAQLFARRLRELTQVTHLSLFIENFHNAEPSAFSYLSDVLSHIPRTGKEQPCFILTIDSEETRYQLQKFIPSTGKITFIDLEPLSEQQTRDVALAMLGIKLSSLSEHPTLPPLFAPLYQETQGKPLFIRTYLRSLIDRGQLTKDGSTWNFQGKQTLSIPSGSTLSRLAQEQVQRLSAQARSTLAMATIIGRDFEFSLLHKLCGLPLEALLDIIDEALKVNVIRSLEGTTQRDVYTFEHHEFLGALEQEISTSDQQALHETIGQLLSKQESPPYAQIAHHFARSKTPAQAIPHLLTAANNALNAQDYPTAERYFLEALEMLQLHPQENNQLVSTLYEGLADAYLGQGQTQRAIQTIQRSLQTLETPLEISRSYRKLARCQFFAGNLDACKSSFEEALDALGARNTESGLGAFFGSIIRWGNRVDTEDKTTDELEERALIHRGFAQILRWSDGAQTKNQIDQQIQVAETLNDPIFLIDAYADQLLTPHTLEQRDRIDTIVQKVQTLLTPSTPPKSRLHFQSHQGIAMFYQGEMALALNALQSSVQQAERAQEPYLHGYTLSIWVWFRLFFSQWEEAKHELQRLQNIASHVQSPRLQLNAHAGLCFLHILQNNLQQAQEEYEQVQQVVRNHPLPAFEALAYQLRGGISFFQKQFDQSLQAFDHALQLYQENHLLGYDGLFLFFFQTETLLCLFDQQGTQAVPDLLAKLRRNQKLFRQHFPNQPIIQGFSSLLDGIIWARQGKKRAAQQAFQQTLDTKSSLKKHYFAGWLMQRVAIELWRLQDNPVVIRTLLERSEETYVHTNAQQLLVWLEQLRPHILR